MTQKADFAADLTRRLALRRTPSEPNVRPPKRTVLGMVMYRTRHTASGKHFLASRTMLPGDKSRIEWRCKHLWHRRNQAAAISVATGSKGPESAGFADCLTREKRTKISELLYPGNRAELSRSDELDDGAAESLWIFKRQHVATLVVDFQLRTGDLLGIRLAMGQRNDAVFAPP